MSTWRLNDSAPASVGQEFAVTPAAWPADYWGPVVGPMEAAGGVSHAAAVSFAGVGTFSASATVLRKGETADTGIGILDTAAAVQRAAAVTDTGVGTIEATASVQRAAAGSFVGAGTFGAGAIVERMAQVSFAGAGSFEAVGEVTTGELAAAVAFEAAAHLDVARPAAHLAAHVSFGGAGEVVTAAEAPATPPTSGGFAFLGSARRQPARRDRVRVPEVLEAAVAFAAGARFSGWAELLAAPTAAPAPIAPPIIATRQLPPAPDPAVSPFASCEIELEEELAPVFLEPRRHIAAPILGQRALEPITPGDDADELTLVLLEAA